MPSASNPILPGFNPDPSIARVGRDYYIATSTFEWFPGVRIHHSRDLAHWELIALPLNRRSQLDMAGNPRLCGIWAPCLSYCDGLFYLAYTDVKTMLMGPFGDHHNYLVTAPHPAGDWSEPIPLNRSGFDPSLFHDDDGRKWLVNVLTDHRPGKPGMNGIVLQEYDPGQQCLTGPIHHIFLGTWLKGTEGPHLYKRNGYYYLLTAEGGTSFGHAVTMARSKRIEGPYEVDPDNPMLTSRWNPRLELQKAGHADLVEAPNGDWYLVHLCSRPLPSRGRCVLGRETAIQRVEWTDDGWLRLADGGREPSATVSLSEPTSKPQAEPVTRDHFDSEQLDRQFQTLRIPLPDSRLSLAERPGFLRLRGADSLSSFHCQALVARRQTAFCCDAQTAIDFDPWHYKHMAGLIAYYDTRNYHYLHVTHDEEQGRCLSTLSVIDANKQFPQEGPIALPKEGLIHLRAEIRYDKLSFLWSVDESTWHTACSELDASVLSDDAMPTWGFTGAMIGLCCQDLLSAEIPAYFDYFEYRPLGDAEAKPYPSPKVSS